MEYTHIIWDFNGTLLNDVDECLDVLNELLVRRNLPKVGLERYREVFGFPVIDYYRSVGFDFERENYGELADEWAILYKSACAKGRLCSGVLDVLEAIKATGTVQLILSATKLDLLKAQVDELGITSYFSELLALDNLYAVSKVQLGINWYSSTPHGRVLFIGDTLHDYETARAMGADCILIANGHQSRTRLEATGALVIDSASELIPYLGI